MGLARRMLSVGVSQALEFALQLLLPVALLRLLSPEDFGIYRLVWLVVGTITLIVPLGMIEVLFYFLPRTAPDRRIPFIRRTELFLILGAVIGVAVVWGMRPWLPEGVARGMSTGPWMVVLVVLWTWGLLLDQLPTIEEHIRWQVATSMAMSVLRAVSTVAVAWVWRDVRTVVATLALLSAVKVIALQGYLHRYHHGRFGVGERTAWRDQLSHALPLGVASLLFNGRRQAEQWIVAILFTPVEFAAYVTAAVLSPLLMMARKSVSFVLLPSMSRSLAEGDTAQVLALNNRVNLTIAAVIFPILGFVAFFAEGLVELVYTRAMLDAAMVMRILIFVWALQVVDLNSLTVILREGAYSSRINLWLFALNLPASYLGGRYFGLAGAAFGGVVAIYIERALLIRRYSRRLGVVPARLQPWRLLAALGLSALAASALAYVSVASFMPLAPLIFRLLTAIILVAVFFATVSYPVLRMGQE